MSVKIWNSLVLKITGILLLVVILLATSIYLVKYNQYYSLSINQIKEKAESIHKFAEDIIDEQSFLILNTKEDGNSEIYIEAHMRLDEIRRIANIEYLYTSKLNENGDPIYVIDGLPTDDEDFRHVGDLIEDYFAPTILSSLSKDEPTFGNEIIVSEWGYLYMACFPFHDSGGHVVGAIVMEFECESLYRAISNTRWITILISVSLASVFILIAYIVIKRVVKKAETVLTETSDKLEAALSQAQTASKAKSEFLANMSHEIRTPMNAVIGMTNIAMTAENTERKDYALSKIWDASNHLFGVINDILDMSKIEANKLELHPVAFVFEELLQKIVSINNYRIVEKRQKLAVYIDENIPRALICDDQRLTQVITNLIGNAVKFTPENGSISLNTKLLRNINGFCDIQFAVSDTGIGISHEQQSRLFMPFEQAENSTTRKYGGTGLGLTITKRIVELMGGDIAVSSAPGEGSTFTFTVKAKKSEDKIESGTLSAHNAVEEIRVLIVDDDDDMLEYFVDIAKRFNISCDKAAGGEEAIALIESGSKYDICFIDWQMPVMDGIELSRRIKEIGDGETIIIMISAFEWQEIEAEAKAAGIIRFLPKPIFPSTFVECINSYFDFDLLNKTQGKATEVADCFEGYCLLLAEDVEINREVVIALLEPTLLKIECAENGVEAVRMFSEEPGKYDMIFMDVQMPEMDGYEATRKIRELDDPQGKKIPIVAMTANVFKEDIDKCLEAGMNAHIGKPLDFDSVFDILRKYLPK